MVAISRRGIFLIVETAEDASVCVRGILPTSRRKVPFFVVAALVESGVTDFSAMVGVFDFDEYFIVNDVKLVAKKFKPVNMAAHVVPCAFGIA